jgi:hypothetical protein
MLTSSPNPQSASSFFNLATGGTTSSVLVAPLLILPSVLPDALLEALFLLPAEPGNHDLRL